MSCTGFYSKSIHLKVADRYIFDYAIISHQNGLILFGGYADAESLKTMARLDLATTSWSKLGELQTPRDGHGVIFDGDVFMIIGGEGNLKTEECTLSGKELKNYLQKLHKNSK